MEILLKVFSGPHLGAEIALAPGTTTLGSSRSCDIVLQDSSVAERHLCIVVPDTPATLEEIQIKTIDASVLLISQEKNADTGSGANQDESQDQGQNLQFSEQVVEGEAQWKPLTPMMLGTTCIAWRFEGESWGEVAGSTAFFGKNFLREKQSSIPGSDSQRSKESTASDQEDPALPKVVLPPIFGKILRAMGLLFIFLLIFGPCMGTNDTRLARDMKHVLKEEGFEFLTVTQTNIGVTVFGIVDTQADRSRLWQMAGKMDYPVFINIRVNEERAFAVKVALSVRGLFPEVELDEKNILIKGYMRDKLIEGASKIWIHNDIFEVDKVNSAMVYAFQVWPVLKDRLIKHKLENLVVIRFHPGLVQVEGELDFDQRQTLEKVKGEVCDSLNSPIAFWDTLTAPGFSDEWNASLNSGLVSKFSPDPALAQLYLDSQSSKGVPAFIASTPVHRADQEQEKDMKGLSLQDRMSNPHTPVSSSADLYSKEKLEEMVKTGDRITDSKGNKLAVLQDKDGNFQGAVLLDKGGKIKQSPLGNPIILPVIKDKEGNIVKDKKGNPVFAQPLKDQKGNILVRDNQVKDSNGNIVAGKPAGDSVARDDKGNILVDEQGRVIHGEVLRNQDGTIKRDEQGNILVRDSKGNIVAGKPAGDSVARDDKGNTLVDDQENPGGFKTPAQLPIITGTVVDGDGNIVLDKDGNPIMGRIAFDRDGNVITEAKGNPVVLGVALDKKGNPLRDTDKKVIPLTIARDADNRVIRDKDGNPLLVPALLDKEGRIVKDKDGNPVAPRVISGSNGKAVFDRDGKLIPDRDANKVLLPPEENDNIDGIKPGHQLPGAESSKENSGEKGTYADTTGGQVFSDKNIFGSGTVVADKLNQERETDPLGGLSIVSITIEPIPFVSMKDGQKFFTGGKLPGGYVIKEIATDKLVLEKQGKTRIFKMRHE